MTARGRLADKRIRRTCIRASLSGEPIWRVKNSAALAQPGIIGVASKSTGRYKENSAVTIDLTTLQIVHDVV